VTGGSGLNTNVFCHCVVDRTPAVPFETSESVATTVERCVRAALVVVSLVGLRRRDPGAVVNGVLALAGTFFPDVVERRYAVTLRPWQRVYVETAMLTHAVGMLGPYDDVPWWDHLTHTHSATVVGGVVHAVARHRNRDPLAHVLPGVFGLGVLWEVLEYVAHGLSRRVGIEPVLVSYSRTDTLLDLLFDLLGAVVVVALGDRLLHNVLPDDESA
jgi:hypothetical protein